MKFNLTAALLVFGLTVAFAPRADALGFDFSFSNASCGWCASFTGTFDGDLDASDPTGNRLVNVRNMMLQTSNGSNFDFSNIFGSQVLHADTLSFDGLANHFVLTGVTDPTVILSFGIGGAAVVNVSEPAGVSIFWNAPDSLNGDTFSDGAWSVTQTLASGPTAAMPEPSAALLFGMGGLLATSSLRRRR